MPYFRPDITDPGHVQAHVQEFNLRPEEAAKVVTVRIECSEFRDPGPDWTKHYFLDANGAKVTIIRQDGY